jgi:hypothetical protein
MVEGGVGEELEKIPKAKAAGPGRGKRGKRGNEEAPRFSRGGPTLKELGVSKKHPQA